MVDNQSRVDVAPPKTPESPLANSLHHASTTIDDLTLALANFSRVASPEPPCAIVCCCGKDDCENTKSWLAIKSDLESRLVLSAEVGQALLQRHEAYLRRQENHHDHDNAQSTQEPRGDHRDSMHESTDLLVDELIREKAALVKRLNRVLINNEVGEASHKALLHELQEARAAISRLTAQNARSVGWDARLSAVMQERDDMQQERDSEAHRARQAESRIAALNARVSKLQVEVQRLREGVEQRRLHRLESSESILQDARVRLEALQNSQMGHTAMAEESEITKVLYSLVEDNEDLKRDNAELHRLLTESREDYHILQQEVEEQRASSPTRVAVPHSKALFLTVSGMTSPSKRNTSAERRLRRKFAQEPLTPETDCRPLSPSTSLTPSDTYVASSLPQPRYLTPNSTFEIDEEHQRDTGSATPDKVQPHKPLLLLSRSRGVQTDLWPGVLGVTTYHPPGSPRDARSDSSSITDSQTSNMTVLVERVALLLNRMTQADALTLTNRLKRQNLKGADLGHLSRVTVGGIVSEAGSLRAQFRHLLEDDKVVTTCTRKDLRGLFKLFKDAFVEMGQMRVTLNDVILDPSIAVKLREMALNPSKAQAAATSSGQTSSGGWMAPISKLFGSSGGENIGASRESPSTEESRGRAKSRPPHRIIPKLGPALSASTTTVNVEFSGNGIGRAVTSTIKGHGETTVGLPSAASGRSPHHTPTGVMGIFAGAPQRSAQDSWVVLQKSPRKIPTRPNLLTPSSLGGESQMNERNLKRLSRNVDAVIDVSSPMDESSTFPPLLQRTLRRRGLSDSSIHSTFMNQADDSRLPPHAVLSDSPSARQTAPDKMSVLWALGRTVQNFRFTTSGSPPVADSSSGFGVGPSGIQPQAVSSAAEGGQTASSIASSPRASSPLAAIIPNISSWAGVSAAMDAEPDPFYVGSGREESLLRQAR